ncbi:MAG: hypothetical protein KGJ57_17370 [Sphingomonadales bacterium]|nr:hypothetical protein [Sphingomonadales bacterium]MDE2171168.1 hypothetical protein [Sphingomonadales bacterium]
MGTLLQLIHDTDTNLDAYTGPMGEMTVSATDGRPRSSGGVAGGKKLAMLNDLTPGAWATPVLLSPWIAYGGAFEAPRYRIDTSGLVTIEGLVQAPSGTSTTSVSLFTLPAGYRPPATLMFNLWSGGGAYRCDVQADGEVVMQACNTAFSSLSGIRFYVD